MSNPNNKFDDLFILHLNIHFQLEHIFLYLILQAQILLDGVGTGVVDVAQLHPSPLFFFKLIPF
jgi:hypothetical protein